MRIDESMQERDWEKRGRRGRERDRGQMEAVTGEHGILRSEDPGHGVAHAGMSSFSIHSKFCLSLRDSLWKAVISIISLLISMWCYEYLETLLCLGIFSVSQLAATNVSCS